MELEIFLIALIARNFLRLYIHCFALLKIILMSTSPWQLSTARFTHMTSTEMLDCNLILSDGMQKKISSEIWTQIAVLNMRTRGHNSVHYHLSYRPMFLRAY